MEFGPFHRVENEDTQPKEIALIQAARGEIWGSAARFSAWPTVRAYTNALPANERGINFTTDTQPDKWSSTPTTVKWYYPGTPGVKHREKDGTDFACIYADIENKQL